MKADRPKRPVQKPIAIGSSIFLMDVADADRYFPSCSQTQLLNILHKLKVPILHMRTAQMFNLYTLERVLRGVMDAGGKDFSFPNTPFLRRNFKGMEGDPGYYRRRVKTELTNVEAAKYASSPKNRKPEPPVKIKVQKVNIPESITECPKPATQPTSAPSNPTT